MADRHRRPPGIELEYRFDRLLATKLEQVYAILVPDRVRRAGEPTAVGKNTGVRSCNHASGLTLRFTRPAPRSILVCLSSTRVRIAHHYHLEDSYD